MRDVYAVGIGITTFTRLEYPLSEIAAYASMAAFKDSGLDTVDHLYVSNMGSGRINNQTARSLHDGAFGFADFGRSYLWYFSSPWLLWLHHLVTLLVTAAFAAGFMTRISAPAAWFLQLMYLHRLTGALFGFDQIVTYCAMYLMFTPCGSCYSVDAYLRRK